MNNGKKTETIRTRIWLEEPEPDNSFATKSAFCHGYDVYGEMLGHSSWVEMLFLLFRGQTPSPKQARLFETLAVALANAGPRDAAVNAAMCGGVGGSTSASCLMAALAVGAGQLSGGREIYLAMDAWNKCGTDLDSWQRLSTMPADETVSIWPSPEHFPGFDPYGISTTLLVKQTLACLAKLSDGQRLPWLESNRTELEEIVKLPLSISGVAAVTLVELGFTSEQGEMIFLLLRLPGAAAHALEHKEYGHKKFPFYQLELEDIPFKEEK